MLRKIFLPTIFLILSWGFWISPEFKVIAAGVAIFLFGMMSLESGFKVFTGGTLEKILKHSTNRFWKSLSFGIVTTSIMQSSSLISLITISFLSAGLISLQAGIGIVFGANLGTTTGAWLVAAFGLKVKIAEYAMPMLVFGTLLIFQHSKSLKGIGYILCGLGFLFLGIHYMKEGFEGLDYNLDLARFAVSGFAGLLLYCLIGMVATVIMQSSHATLVLTLTALANGQISYESALALAIGANIGTTITAIIGSLSANEQGKRLALAHLVFNFTTALLALILMNPLLSLVDLISTGLGIQQTSYSMKLAVFHTLFNLFGVVVMMPVVKPMARMLTRFIPDKTPSRLQPRHLHDSAIGYADTATESVRKETLHVWENTIDLIAHSINVPKEQVVEVNDRLNNSIRYSGVTDSFDLDRFYQLRIKSLYSAIIGFISRASISWDLEQSGEVHWLRKANQDMVDAIKNIKHLRKNMILYSKVPNTVIKRQYDAIRLEIARVVSSIEQIRHAKPEQMPSLMIDQIRLEIDTEYKDYNKSVSELIQAGRIDSEMAISLMNDLSYLYNFSTHLIDMAHTLFIKHNKELSGAEKTVQLDEQELRDIQDRHESEAN